MGSWEGDSDTNKSSQPVDEQAWRWGPVRWLQWHRDPGTATSTGDGKLAGCEDEEGLTGLVTFTSLHAPP